MFAIGVAVTIRPLFGSLAKAATARWISSSLQAEGLFAGFSFENLLADIGFDSDRFRASIAQLGAQAVIPSSRSRSQAIPYDKPLYEERNLVERFINKIKHYRRIATRYEKTALSFASMLSLVGECPQDLVDKI